MLESNYLRPEIRCCSWSKQSLSLVQFFHYNPGVSINEILGVQTWEAFLVEDDRGRFFKTYSEDSLPKQSFNFQTIEHFFTVSKKNVLRGLHFQGPDHESSKIVTLVQGKAIDYLFDIRRGSETYGKLQTIELSDVSPKSIFIPPGVAHGYFVLEERTIFSYRQNISFCPICDTGINPILLESYLPVDFDAAIVSQRDKELLGFEEYEYKSRCNL